MMVDFVLWKGMVLFSVSMDEIGFCLPVRFLLALLSEGSLSGGPFVWVMSC